MDLGLEDRVVLVTGSSSGIGAAIARMFAKEGARVAITYRDDEAGATRLAEELNGLAVCYSLAEPESVESAARTVVAEWGGIDVLVANAVRWAPRRLPDEHFEDVDQSVWRSFLDDNLPPTLRTVQLAVPSMRERGWGRIVLVSSHVALDGHRGQEFYGAAKAALHAFARNLSWDVGPDGVLVNVVAPGLTTTDRVLGGLPEAIRTRETGHTPTGRLSSPEDIAGMVVHLCSAVNGNTTGQVITVAGGR